MEYLLEYEEWQNLNEGFFFNHISVVPGYGEPNGIVTLIIGANKYAYQLDNAAIHIFEGMLKNKKGHTKALKYINDQSVQAWKFVNGNWNFMEKNGLKWKATNNVDKTPPLSMRLDVNY